MAGDLAIHPLADLFPMVEGIEFEELTASVKAHGLYDAITLLDGTILDGRNRYRACQAAGVEPRFEDFTGDDAYAFVASKNLHRRHLTASQRGIIGAKMAKLAVGRPRQSESVGIPTFLPSVERVAEMMNVSRDTVMEAKTVLAEGTADEIKSVERGKAAVSSTAAKIRARRMAKKTRKNRRTQPAPAIEETQHDRDLQFLQGAWNSACQSARAAFVRGLGLTLNDAA